MAEGSSGIRKVCLVYAEFWSLDISGRHTYGSFVSPPSSALRIWDARLPCIGTFSCPSNFQRSSRIYFTRPKITVTAFSTVEVQKELLVASFDDPSCSARLRGDLAEFCGTCRDVPYDRDDRLTGIGGSKLCILLLFMAREPTRRPFTS